MPCRPIGLRSACPAMLLLWAATIPGGPLRADLVWEDHFSDEQSIADGTVVSTALGIDVTLTRSVFSDSDGGTFDLGTGSNSDYFTFESGQLGRHFGYLEASFDNQNNDPADYLELTLTFSRAVSHLQFSLLDVDSAAWDDAVEVYYNGSLNVRDTPGFFTTGTHNEIDDELYMHGFEGSGKNAGNGRDVGNIAFDFGDTHVTSLRIRYFSTDDANANPPGQQVGLSDLAFTPGTPEPPAFAMVGLFATACLLTALRRRSRAQPA